MASAPWPRLVSMKWASGTPMQIERQMAHPEPNSGATCITRRPLPVANGTLFHRRESADPAESVKCSLFRDSDGSSWVEHAREPAGASPATYPFVRVGRFFAYTEDAELLGRHLPRCPRTSCSPVTAARRAHRFKLVLGCSVDRSQPV